jgi:hypothetical protein
MSSIFKKPETPKIVMPEAAPMPDPQNKMAINRRKKKATKKYGEGGRESTILSGKLGG